MTGPSATFGFRDVDASEKPGLVRGVFDLTGGEGDCESEAGGESTEEAQRHDAAPASNARATERALPLVGNRREMLVGGSAKSDPPHPTWIDSM